MKNPFSSPSTQSQENGDEALAQVSSLLVHLRGLIRTLDTAHRVSGTDRILEDLMEVHRALSIIDLLQDQYLIAVAGPQGAGKTTTLQWLYGIPDDFLPTNIGTGERLPVAVVEHEGQDFKSYVRSYDRQEESLKRKPLSASACREAVTSPKDNHILVELHVPPRLFESPGEGFLLLPGVESSDAVHVRLARHVLPVAATALICVDDTQLAHDSVEREINRVQEGMTTDEIRLIFALTKLRDAEKTQQAIETLQERFDIENPNRIVPISRVNDAANGHRVPEWRDALADAVARYGTITREQRRAEHNQLRRLLRKTQSAVSRIRQKVKLSEAETSGDYEENVRPILNEFDKAAETQREELKRYLKKRLSTYGKKAAERVKKEIADKESRWNKAKRVLLRQEGTLRSQLDFKDLLQRNWKSDDPSGPSLRVVEAMNETVNQALPRQGGLPKLKGNNSTAVQLLGTFQQPEVEDGGGKSTKDSQQIILDSDVVSDVRYLMTASDEERASVNLRRNVRAVPALALEAVRLGFIERLEAPDPKADIAPEDSQLMNHFQDTRQEGKQMLKGVLAALGVDALPDAELDIVNDLLSMVGGGGAVAAGPAAVAVGGLMVAYGAVSVMKTIRQDDIGRAKAAEDAFEHMVRQTRNKVLKEYDAYMRRLRTVLLENLRSRYKLNTPMADRSNVLSATGKVEKSVRSTKESANWILGY